MTNHFDDPSEFCGLHVNLHYCPHLFLGPFQFLQRPVLIFLLHSIGDTVIVLDLFVLVVEARNQHTVLSMAVESQFALVMGKSPLPQNA